MQVPVFQRVSSGILGNICNDADLPFVEDFSWNCLLQQTLNQFGLFRRLVHLWSNDDRLLLFLRRISHLLSK